MGQRGKFDLFKNRITRAILNGFINDIEERFILYSRSLTYQSNDHDFEVIFTYIAISRPFDRDINVQFNNFESLRKIYIVTI